MKGPVDCARPIEGPKAPRIPAERTRFATNRRENNQFRNTMEPPVPLGSVEKATRYIIQRSHRPMADKAPKFARTPLSDPSDLPGACHLLARRFQPGLPALGGGLSGAWHLLGRGGPAWFASIGRRSVQCLAPVGRAVSTWFASIGRRSIRCLAPVGRAVFNLVCQHWTAGLSGAWHEWHCTPGVRAQVL